MLFVTLHFQALLQIPNFHQRPQQDNLNGIVSDINCSMKTLHGLSSQKRVVATLCRYHRLFSLNYKSEIGKYTTENQLYRLVEGKRKRTEKKNLKRKSMKEKVRYEVAMKQIDESTWKISVYKSKNCQ